MENYNDWNLPFAFTFIVEDSELTGNFPTNTYQLEADPSAYFSIIFVDTSLTTIENPVTLNYTFFGQNDYTLDGEWKELTFKFNFEGVDIELPLTTFVCYMASPESGTKGSLGLA